jgi:delta-aminolevulinic acid dehydratase/porphobilinogen synthase
MVKPALPYLDVIRARPRALRRAVAAYNVSRRVRDGQGRRAARLLDERQAALESLTAISEPAADDRLLLGEGAGRWL